MNDSPPLMASKDVCRKLDIDRSTLTRWVKKGIIAPVMQLPGPAGAFLFDEADVVQLERDRAAKAA